jgi:long-chain acyl-CoA synthetase
VLSTHPAVALVAVFGVSHETHGQEVMAAVTLMPGMSVEDGDLVAFVQEHVAAYKYPRRVEVLESLPLGPSGKVLKRELIARFDTA